jgi:hypothetical protein
MTPAEHYQKMTHYLRIFYSEVFYQRHGITHPILWYPAAPEQINNVDSVLGKWDARGLETPPEFPVYDYGYLQTMQNSGRNVFNGITFTFKNLRRSPLRVDCSLGRYFDMLATSGALERELRDAAQESAIRVPMRSQYHRHIQPIVALKSGRGRSAAMGVACLTVANIGGEYKALLARRSSKNATDPGFFHLLPAFIFQPASAAVRDEEWRVSYHIYREYLEELFGMPEITSSEQRFDGHPALLYLHELMQQGKAGLYLTGVSLNLLTLRAEISALLLIHDAAWYARVTAPDSDMRLNAEAETQGGIVTVPIATDEALLAALPPDVHTIMPPQAVGALWEGVDLARKIINHGGTEFTEVSRRKEI